MSAKKENIPPVRTLRVLRSFEILAKGETFENVVTGRVQELVNAGFLEVLCDGESPSGPASAEPRDQGGEPEGSSPEGSAGAEPGEDPRAG